VPLYGREGEGKEGPVRNVYVGRKGIRKEEKGRREGSERREEKRGGVKRPAPGVSGGLTEVCTGSA